jgi:ornithine cyclodeaminase/alanine dehydrogenase-like protein (mu-crystallin family)
MTLIITGADVERLLTMGECIDAMGLAFKDFAEGIAVNRPRVRYLAQHPDAGKRYWANIHAGASPSAGIACVRAGSQVKLMNAPGSERTSRNENPRPFNWGLVILYSIETAEPLALMHEFELSGMRVGATTGAAVDRVARPDAAVLGLFGSGKQARAALEAVAAIRPIERVNVYSPNAAHREAFARDFAPRNFEVVACDDPKAAVTGADVICCATSSAVPVYDGEWLEDGQMVVSIANSDTTHKRIEVDRRTFERARAVIINDWESVAENDQTELLEPIAEGIVDRDQVIELGELFTGAQSVIQPGRDRGEEGIVYYKNNSGLAIQFAAAGGIIYRKALAEGGCKEIPTEWLGSDLSGYLEAGFYPSP